MLSAEDIENWNKIFLNGPIQETNLKHPTESFVVGALVAFLEKLGYKLKPPNGQGTEAENASSEKRLFLVRLAKTIDRILKYTDKSYACFYLDIIKPVPKRTSLMLEVLLNHYYYYEMFVSDVFQIEQVNIQERNNLIRNVEKIRSENVKKRELAAQMKDEIRELTIILPTTTQEIKNLNTIAKQRKEELAEITTKVEQLQEKVINLQAREESLQNQIVNDEEALMLKTEVQELEKNIRELDPESQSAQIDLKDCIEQCTKVEKLLKSLEGIQHLIFLQQQILEYHDIMQKIEANSAQYGKTQQEVETLRNNIAKLTVDINAANEEFKVKKMNFEQGTRDQLMIVCENKKRLIKEKNWHNSLNDELLNVKDLIDEQKEIYEQMLEFIEYMNFQS